MKKKKAYEFLKFCNLDPEFFQKLKDLDMKVHDVYGHSKNCPSHIGLSEETCYELNKFLQYLDLIATCKPYNKFYLKVTFLDKFYISVELYERTSFFKSYPLEGRKFELN